MKTENDSNSPLRKLEKQKIADNSFKILTNNYKSETFKNYCKGYMYCTIGVLCMYICIFIFVSLIMYWK